MRTSSVTTTEEQSFSPTDPRPHRGRDFNSVCCPPSVEAVAREAALALLGGRSSMERAVIQRHWLSFNLDDCLGLGPARPSASGWLTASKLSRSCWW
jgi:hypothetical protein